MYIFLTHLAVRIFIFSANEFAGDVSGESKFISSKTSQLRLTHPLQKALLNTLQRGVLDAAEGAKGFLEDSQKATCSWVPP